MYDKTQLKLDVSFQYVLLARDFIFELNFKWKEKENNLYLYSLLLILFLLDT